MAGGCHVLIPKFDMKSAFDAILEHRVTSFITVPAIMADLLSYARYDNGDTIWFWKPRNEQFVGDWLKVLVHQETEDIEPRDDRDKDSQWRWRVV